MIRCQRPFIFPKVPRNKGFPAIRLLQMGVPVIVFFCLPPVPIRVFLHDLLGRRVNLHGEGLETCIFTRSSCLPCKIHVCLVLPTSVLRIISFSRQIFGRFFSSFCTILFPSSLLSTIFIYDNIASTLLFCLHCCKCYLRNDCINSICHTELLVERCTLVIPPDAVRIIDHDRLEKHDVSCVFFVAQYHIDSSHRPFLLLCR